MMGTGLESDVERRASRPFPRRLERDDLGVGTARALVPALPHGLASGDDDRADDRVRVRRAATSLGELERPLKPRLQSP